MKLKNVLNLVKNIEKERIFYNGVFGLKLLLNNNCNMIPTESIVLKKEKYRIKSLVREIFQENNRGKIYFEKSDIDGFVKELGNYYHDVKCANKLITYGLGKNSIGFYNLDGNLIEVGISA